MFKCFWTIFSLGAPEEIFASCFCFNIEDFSRVICQPKQLLSLENKHEESFLSILWDQIMNKQSCFPLEDAKNCLQNMLFQ